MSNEDTTKHIFIEGQNSSIRPNIIMLVALLYFQFGTTYVFRYIGRPLITALGFDINNLNWVFERIYGLFVLFGVPIVIYILYLIITKQRISPVFYFKKIDMKNLGFIVILTFAFSFIVNPFLLDTPSILSSTPQHIPNRTPLYTFISGMVLVSIFEELMFRGFLISEYKRHRVAFWKIALATGLLFGLIHFGLQPVIFTAINGILWAYMLYLTRSMWAVMLSHFIANSGVFWHPAVYINDLSTYQAVMPVYAIIMIVLAVASIPAFIIFVKKFVAYNSHNRIKKEDLPKETMAFAWTYWALIIVLLGVIVIFRI